jgi:hypothetical protein
MRNTRAHHPDVSPLLRVELCGLCGEMDLTTSFLPGDLVLELGILLRPGAAEGQMIGDQQGTDRYAECHTQMG